MTESHGYAVCGAIGPWALAGVEELRSLQGMDGPPLLASEDVVFDARGSVRRWAHGASSGWSWGQAHLPSTPPTRWEDVAREGSAGLVVADGAVVLHADAPGVVPLFVAVHGDAVLFSSSLDALARAYPGGRLHVDREAWWELLASSGAMSMRTPFAELRRLAPGAAHHRGPSGRLERRRVERWPELGPERTVEAAAGELVERVRDVTRRSAGASLTVPLSGGWDSRFLAAAAVADGRPTTTVTAADDQGRLEEEVAWARQVADRLGLAHEVLDAPTRWWDTFVAAASDTHHLTSLHHWFEPLKDHLAGTPGTVQDGLAAGVVLRNGMLADDAATGTTEAAGEAVAARLAAPVRPTELLAPGLADAVDAHVAARVAASWEEVATHPAAPVLQVLELRTTTSITLAPMAMLAPVVDVVTPFTAREVLEVALAVPVADKAGGRLYREVMARLGRGLDTITSTNDTRPTRRRVPRPDLAPDVAARTRRALDHDLVRDAVGPRLRARMAGGRVLQPDDRRHRDVVRGLALYTVWATRYASLLVDPALVPPPGGTWGPGPTHLTGPHPPPRSDAGSTPDPPSGAVRSDELPDQRWLPQQVVGRTAYVRWREADGGSGSGSGSSPGPGGADTGGRTIEVVEVQDGTSAPGTAGAEGRGGPEGRGAPEPGRGYDLVLLAGPWDGLTALERAIAAARSSLATDGRVAVSFALTRAPAEATAPGVLECCELLVGHLEPVHAEVRHGRVRLVARPRPVTGRGGTHRLPPLLLAGIVAGLERREVAGRTELAQLRRELREATEGSEPAPPPRPRRSELRRGARPRPWWARAWRAGARRSRRA